MIEYFSTRCSRSMTLGSTMSALLIKVTFSASCAPGEYFTNRADLRLRVGVQPSDDVQQQIKVGNLFQC